MTGPIYGRPPGHGDFERARDFEQAVADALEPETHHLVTQFDSTTRLDIWVPGFMLDIKEKRQRLSDRWTVHAPAWDERDCFIIDELSIRRCLEKSVTETYFLLRDVPEGRMFICSALEVAMAERVRLDRQTSPGNLKGKWLVNLQQFRRLPSVEQAYEFITADLADMPWKQSQCLAHIWEVPKP